ncbi:MAG: isopentenyl-diphosphate Delta-isomerase [Bacteroidetes bacterium]|nr:isopentenyl-diphosphate Delta-isomerase [Bacteroidota bacterium]
MTNNIADNVILVNERNEWTGMADKMEAHHKGMLHRALSVFILNDRGEMLLQRRAAGKYHSGGLWSNACCSHPRPLESTHAAAIRRLAEEMGITTPLSPLFNFRYRCELNNGMVENEYDHVYVGVCNDLPKLDPSEASDYRYMHPDEITLRINRAPGDFTPWFLLLFPAFIEHWHRQNLHAA